MFLFFQQKTAYELRISDCSSDVCSSDLSLTMLQLVAFAVCFLDDHRAIPIMPKWVSWFCAWVAFTFLVLAIMPFFKDGPFSRSGIFNYWVEFTIFFLVMLIMSIFTLQIGRASCRERGVSTCRYRWSPYH